MATQVDPDSERIKSLRVRRAWSQEQLADIAGVSHRTIQRIEAGSKASFESLRAIASAFDLDVNEILKKAQPARNEAQEPPQRFLLRITTGKELFDILGGAHAGHFDNDELHTQEDVNLVGAFIQEMRDYLDIWDDIEPSNRIQAEFDYNGRIRTLDEAGFWVFASRERRKMRVGSDVINDGRVATVVIVRSDNPAILCYRPSREAVPNSGVPRSG